jgi:hypothetical protein
MRFETLFQINILITCADIYLIDYLICCSFFKTLMCIIHRIFLDFFHRPVFQKNTTFRKLDLFPSSGEGGEKALTQLGPLERANLNSVMEIVQKNSVNSVQHTPSSESFQVYLMCMFVILIRKGTIAR